MLEIISEKSTKTKKKTFQNNLIGLRGKLLSDIPGYSTYSTGDKIL